MKDPNPVEAPIIVDLDASDELELSDDELDLVVGGLDRPWIPGEMETTDSTSFGGTEGSTRAA